MGTLTEAMVKEITEPGRYSYGDGMGLCLVVLTRGTKLWRQDIRWLKERLTVNLSSYPEVSPSSAVSQAKEHRRKLRQTTTREEARKCLDKIKWQTPAIPESNQTTAKGALAALGELMDNMETKMKELSKKLDRVEAKVDRLQQTWSE